MTYLATKFEVATSKGLGGDTFTRNMTDRRINVGKKRVYQEISLKKTLGCISIVEFIFYMHIAVCYTCKVERPCSIVKSRFVTLHALVMKCQTLSGSKLFDTQSQIVFLKDFFFKWQ